MPTSDELRLLQALPLELKIRRTKQRIKEWVEEFGEDGVYVSFSGGKDSTVLLHIVRQLYANVEGVYCDTGLEFPELREFVRTFDNITWIKPKMSFKKVLNEYGYPIISKDVSQLIGEIKRSGEIHKCSPRDTRMYQRRFNPQSEYLKKYPSYSAVRWDFLFDADFKISNKCCSIMKKQPFKEYEKSTNKKAILAIMAEESTIRRTKWLREGCNAFSSKRQISSPMSFWKEQDVLQYIKKFNIEICSVYGDVQYDDADELNGQMSLSDIGLCDDNRKLKLTKRNRTGCMFCAYGCHMPSYNGFIELKKSHPKIYQYIMKPKSDGGLGYADIIDWLNKNGSLNIKY